MDNITLSHYENSTHNPATLDKVLETIQQYRDGLGFWPCVGDYLEIRIESDLDMPGIDFEMGVAYLYINERHMRLSNGLIELEYNTSIVGIDDEVEGGA